MSSSQNAIDTVGERLRAIVTHAHSVKYSQSIINQAMWAQEDLGRVRLHYLQKIEPMLDDLTMIISKSDLNEQDKNYMKANIQNIRNTLLK